MWAFVVRRLANGVLVIIGVSILTFMMTVIIPSDPAARWAGVRATAEQIAKAREELGLDKPLHVQYWRYVTGVVHGNLGTSIRTRQPVLDDLKAYIPATAELVITGMIMALVIGMPLGIWSAVRKDSWVDHLCRAVAVFGVSLPTFWLAMNLQVVFFRWLGWLPLGGRLSGMIEATQAIPNITGFLLVDSAVTLNGAVFWDSLEHLLLPAITLAAYPIGLVAKQIRSSLLEVFGEDYILAARAYGLPNRLVTYRYALRNALAPTITVFALCAGYSLVNTFLIEAVFNWPGLGNYSAMAVITGDYPAIMGITLFVAVVYVVLNLAVDVLIALDPRVRF
ncbi:MAG: ABC transporter permease [Bacillota bacterium]|nr:MAG: ABC transporter permease [Bacillota bacterium]